MVASHDLRVSVSRNLEGSPNGNITASAPPRQIRLRTLLLAVGILAIPLAAIRYGWIEIVMLFPFLFVGGVGGGIALSSVFVPARPYLRPLGAMIGGGLATLFVFVLAVLGPAPWDSWSSLAALWSGAAIFVTGAIAGGATCLCWEVFWMRSHWFPLLRNRRGER